VLRYAIVKQRHDSERPTAGIDYGENGDVMAELAAIYEELRQSGALDYVLLIRRSAMSASARSFHWLRPVHPTARTPSWPAATASAG